MANRFYQNARRLYSKIFLPKAQERPFYSGTILHFSYHKCLTVYYNRIMTSLSEEFGFSYQECFYVTEDRLKHTVAKKSKNQLLNISMSGDISFEDFPSYRGSHFIRDPRDLLISGYRYHTWTDEEWCNTPFPTWKSIVQHPFFSEYVEENPAKYPVNISYKSYLNSLPPEQGIIVEMLWRQHHFTQMNQWDYNNKNILEKKYEEIVGNEVDAFQDIFMHYQFHPDLMDRGLELVTKFSLKNQVKADKSHIRSGDFAQWRSQFSDVHRKLFKQLNGELLIKLGYEVDLLW